jgi:Tripartite tricarboxylate transporter family receptor
MDFNFSRKLVLITVKLHQASNLATGLAAAGVAAVLATATPGRSAQWPARPVTVIVPLAAGGNTDMMAWLGAQSLTEKLGQTFIVENRPSAGGAIGWLYDSVRAVFNAVAHADVAETQRPGDDQ